MPAALVRSGSSERTDTRADESSAQVRRLEHDASPPQVAAGGSRVLYVSGQPLVPSKLGPARRNHHVIAQLSRFYQVSVVGIGEDADAATLRAGCPGSLDDVRFVRARRSSNLKFVYKVWRTASGRCDFVPAGEPALRRTFADMMATTRFDAVVLSSVLLGPLVSTASTQVIADTHNVEFDVHRRTAAHSDRLLRRAYAAAQWRWTRNAERRFGRQARLLLATSERDRHLFESELQIEGPVVIPNGIDLEEFRPVPAVRNPIILFSGLMSYYPNQQGIRWFLDEVFPSLLGAVPRVKLVVAGAAPPQWLLARRSGNVEVTGRVEDMRPYIASAAVVIAPLHIGGGTRVKILEAQAMRRPVVSTTIGAEGLRQRDGHTLLLGDDARDFARHVARLLQDPGAADQIAEHGYRHVVANFDWNAIGEQLARVLNVRLGLTSRV